MKGPSPIIRSNSILGFMCNAWISRCSLQRFQTLIPLAVQCSIQRVSASNEASSDSQVHNFECWGHPVIECLGDLGCRALAVVVGFPKMASLPAFEVACLPYV